MPLASDVTWVDLIQMSIAVIGVPMLIYQVFMVSRNIKGATHDRVYAHYNSICDIFVQKPELRPYFYNNKPVDGVDDTLRAEIDAVSESIMGLIEHAVVQRANMPKYSWRSCWRPYAKERIKKSNAIRAFFSPNDYWYTEAVQKEFRSIADEIKSEEALAR